MPMVPDNVASMPEVVPSVRETEDRMRRDRAGMAALCRAQICAALASSQAAICGTHEVTGALLAFLQSRAKDGLTATAELAACDSPEAALEIQVEYGKAMVQAWTDDLARLSALTGRIVAEVVAPSSGRPVAAAERARGSGGPTAEAGRKIGADALAA